MARPALETPQVIFYLVVFLEECIFLHQIFITGSLLLIPITSSLVLTISSTFLHKGAHYFKRNPGTRPYLHFPLPTRVISSTFLFRRHDSISSAIANGYIF